MQTLSFEITCLFQLLDIVILQTHRIIMIHLLVLTDTLLNNLDAFEFRISSASQIVRSCRICERIKESLFSITHNGM